jgi:hypothetical protein
MTLPGALMLGLLLGRDVDADQAPPCEIAKRPFTAIEASTLAEPIKERLRSYRRGWQALCARAPGHPSLDSLLGEAIALYHLTDTKEINLAGMRPILDYDNRLIPGMGPGMDYPLYPYQEEFAQTALRYGTATDRFFWKRYPVVDRVLSKPPWILGTWDYGGCPRYGEYDWIAGVRALEELKARRLGPTYRKLSREAERELWNELEWFSPQSQMCTCGSVAAVVIDLERILRFLRRTPALQGHYTRLRARIRAIESGSVEVLSYAAVAERCRGG